MRLITFFLVMLNFISFSYADQCEWNNATDASSALKLIKNNDIIFWCQNCNEKKPSAIFKVTSAKTKRAADSKYRIVNVQAEYLVAKEGTDLDLAYTYVRVASDMFANVAQLVGCPSEGATTFIQTFKGGKKIAHYYDQAGVRQDITTSTTDLKGADLLKLENRIPASVK